MTNRWSSLFTYSHASRVSLVLLSTEKRWLCHVMLTDQFLASTKLNESHLQQQQPLSRSFCFFFLLFAILFKIETNVNLTLSKTSLLRYLWTTSAFLICASVHSTGCLFLIGLRVNEENTIILQFSFVQARIYRGIYFFIQSFPFFVSHTLTIFELTNVKKKSFRILLRICRVLGHRMSPVWNTIFSFKWYIYIHPVLTVPQLFL